MIKITSWIHKNTKIAADWGHGDTLEGQMMKRTLKKITSRLTELREKAAQNKMNDVLPRWRGEIRRQIFQLPSVELLNRLSMTQLNELESKIEDIDSYIKKYDTKRFWERAGNANKN